MTTAALTDKDLSAARKAHGAGKLTLDELGAEIARIAGKKARELTKDAGVTDPVVLEQVTATSVRKDADGNWLFNY